MNITLRHKKASTHGADSFNRIAPPRDIGMGHGFEMPVTHAWRTMSAVASV
jgi:hypothetical protein